MIASCIFMAGPCCFRLCRQCRDLFGRRIIELRCHLHEAILGHANTNVRCLTPRGLCKKWFVYSAVMRSENNEVKTLWK